MRLDRDTFILIITLGPAAFVIYCVVSWQATGVWPVVAPDITIPLPSLPDWITNTFKVPPGAQSTLDRARQTWPIMVAGLAAGLVLGVMAVGTMADLVRAGARALSRQGRGDSDDHDPDDLVDPSMPA